MGSQVIGRYFFLVPYGDWLVGLSDVPCFVAWERTAPSERSIFNAMTRVGVFPLARVLSSFLSEGVHSAPLFLGVFAILVVAFRFVTC